MSLALNLSGSGTKDIKLHRKNIVLKNLVIVECFSDEVIVFMYQFKGQW